MNNKTLSRELINRVIEISKEAGKAILEVYNTNFDYQIKEDLSPLTKADTLSHNIICERLEVLTPDIPILSEEDSDIPFNIRSQWQRYWLVDPLDGTKEFLNRNGEFTVNIALIDNHNSILGVIHIPTTSQTYWGSNLDGSYMENRQTKPVKISVSKIEKRPITIVSSRSHYNENLDSYLGKFNNYQLISKGSSLKFCLVASGKAEIYPRLGPTSEWDIAAGHAIAEFAGARIVNFSKENIRYNTKDSYINPSFIVANDISNIEKLLSK